ncbi:MAG: hypothetical protein BWY81_00955 [Firmicutes bacterium ADurb.Bin467]|nr:MAG: hypothetical protein BWY81_00955 [Firmicutes bacterium ADurb.Bin467]
MSAAPVDIPSGLSNSSSSSDAKSMPAERIMSASSRVVSTASTFGMPSFFISSRAISNFFAVQGMTETTNMFAGSTPISRA